MVLIFQCVHCRPSIVTASPRYPSSRRASVVWSQCTMASSYSSRRISIIALDIHVTCASESRSSTSFIRNTGEALDIYLDLNTYCRRSEEYRTNTKKKYISCFWKWNQKTICQQNYRQRCDCLCGKMHQRCDNIGCRSDAVHDDSS